MSSRPDPVRPDLGVRDGRNSVLVAVNGGASGWHALDWAAAESEARGSSLRIVHVLSKAVLALDPLGGVASTWWATEAREVGSAILDDAARRAHLISPDVAISTHLEDGGAAGTIRRTGRGDSLIVVGRGHARWSAPTPVGWRIARRTRIPVAVVELDEGPRTGSAVGRVVLGINEAAGPPAAVTFAFQAASRRGTGLTVIHASAAATRGLRVRNGRLLEDRRKPTSIDDSLRRHADAFPDVDVVRRFVSGAAGPALVAEADAAALLVIGARSLNRRHNARVSSIARTVLTWARSPIAIIPDPVAASLVSTVDRSNADRSGQRTTPDG